MDETAQRLRKIYQRRFGETAAYRNLVWRELTRVFFNRWVGSEDAVLDLGCGYGEFINNVSAKKKWAMDLNPDASRHLAEDVVFLPQDCSSPWPLPEGSLDEVFTSNFLEHLPNKESLKRTLRQIWGGLKRGGRFIALGPNIKYLPGQYWDFFDHHIALTELSLTEALEVEGFIVEQATPRFLPYTLVNTPRYPLFFLRLYLMFPKLWWIKGKQFLVIARKPT
ncbi:MAG: class I SAM-dependent methyltransferase [Limisphaerales bacterium]